MVIESPRLEKVGIREGARGASDDFNKSRWQDTEGRRGFSLKGKLLDQYDIVSAISRMFQLLARDLDAGIPDNVPLRGYYLNILV